jgi:glycosyltransferase involved in cell wall biosynthesis
VELCQKQNIPARTIHDPGPLPFAAALSLRRELKERGVDVVHGHDYKANAVAVLAGLGQAWPLVATVHLHTRSDRWLRLYHRVDGLVLRRFQQVILVAASLADSLPSSIRKTTTVVVNGVNLPDPGQLCPRDESRRSLGLGSRQVAILALGRLARQKGFDVLVPATSRLLDRIPHLVVLIAGEGPERRRLERLIVEMGLQERIRLLGFRQDVPRLLAAADLVVLPSRSEGTPYALLEALAHSRPVVATAVGGIPQVLGEGFVRVLVPPGDPEALAAAIQEVMDDTELRGRLARKGREVVAGRFSAQKMARSTALVYEGARP